MQLLKNVPENLFEHKLHVKWPFQVVNTHYYPELVFFFYKSVFRGAATDSGYTSAYQQQPFSDNFPAHLP